MKTALTPNYVFTPSTKEIKTNIPYFDINRLYAIINQTNGLIIYSTASTTAGYTSYNSSTDILTLQFDTTAQGSTNELQFIYDDPSLDFSLEDISANMGALVNIFTTLRSTAGFLRVVTDPNNSTLTSVGVVSTVSTVTSVSQFGGISAIPVVPSIINQLAIQSNINNIKIT